MAACSNLLCWTLTSAGARHYQAVPPRTLHASCDNLWHLVVSCGTKCTRQALRPVQCAAVLTLHFCLVSAIVWQQEVHVVHMQLHSQVTTIVINEHCAGQPCSA